MQQHPPRQRLSSNDDLFSNPAHGLRDGPPGTASATPLPNHPVTVELDRVITAATNGISAGLRNTG